MKWQSQNLLLLRVTLVTLGLKLMSHDVFSCFCVSNFIYPYFSVMLGTSAGETLTTFEVGTLEDWTLVKR
jgi:hypothetical protein